MQSRYKTIVLVNTITLVMMLFANFVAGSGKFINKSVGDISNKYDTLFTPAGYAFSIWSLIFLLLICFCIYQWYLVKKGYDKEYVSHIGYWFAMSNVANSLWLVCWINEWLGLSVLVIFFLLLCLSMLMLRLRINLVDQPLRTRIFVGWPISIYLGWIMVATIACVSAWLVSTGYTGGAIGEETWAILMIVVAAILYVLLLRTRHITAALFVAVWAFVAIAVKQWDAHHTISVTALIASFVVLIAIIIHGYKNRQGALPQKDRALNLD